MDRWGKSTSGDDVVGMREGWIGGLVFGWWVGWDVRISQTLRTPKHIKNATWPEGCGQRNEKTRKRENQKTEKTRKREIDVITFMLHMPKAVITFMFKVLRNGLLRYIL